MLFVNPKPVFAQALRTIQLSLAMLWLYQGLIPKILFQSPAEITIWQNLGLELALAKVWVGFSGICEMLFGLCFLCLPFNSSSKNSVKPLDNNPFAFMYAVKRINQLGRMFDNFMQFMLWRIPILISELESTVMNRQ